MKATLEYDLNEPQDRRDHLRAIKSTDLVLAVEAFLNDLRDMAAKHGGVVWESIAAGKLRNELEERDVNLEELT